MNKKKQIIAIAKFHDRILHPDNDSWRILLRTTELPDYLNDLNAVHEVERKLPSDLWHVYLEWLLIICGKRCHMIKVYGATAAQRAEALLRTIGKWSDE